MILGQASAAELEDLVRAKDYSMQQLQAAWESFSPHWVQTDPKAVEDFRSDLRALNKRYEDARKVALLKVENARVQARVQSGVVTGILLGPLAGAFAARDAPDLRNVPAQAEWDGVLKALKQAWDAKTQTGAMSPGDFDDLDSRLSKAQGRAVDYKDMPQPKVDSDADLNLFKKADVLLRSVGVLEPSAGQFPWARVILGGVAGGVLGVVMLPHYLVYSVLGGATAGFVSSKVGK